MNINRTININKKEERRLQIMELRNNYSPIANEYIYIPENLEKINYPKGRSNNAVLDKKVIVTVMIYISIFLVAAIFYASSLYEISNLGIRKAEIQKKLKEIKTEVDQLENIYISNYDLKKIQEKAKELGFVPNDTIRYININK